MSGDFFSLPKAKGSCFGWENLPFLKHWTHKLISVVAYGFFFTVKKQYLLVYHPDLRTAPHDELHLAAVGVDLQVVAESHIIFELRVGNDCHARACSPVGPRVVDQLK